MHMFHHKKVKKTIKNKNLATSKSASNPGYDVHKKGVLFSFMSFAEIWDAILKRSVIHEKILKEEKHAIS